MQEVVTYHNDFNKIRIPKFGAVEQNLLMGILTHIKDRQGEIIRIYDWQLKKLVSKNITDNEIDTYLKTLKDNFFKADYSFIYETHKHIVETTINLFKTFKIYKERATRDFECLELSVNEDFAYLVNDLTENFTQFELAEFIALNGKYTKTLYRLLKQYRKTGWLQMDWVEFCDVMDIPENKAMGDIDKFILKPALKELQKENNLFDYGKRTPFKNLSYEKIKQKGTRGRGGKVIGIRFTFKKENETEQENKYLIGGRTSKKISLEQAKNNLLGQKFEYQNEIWKVSYFGFDDEKNCHYAACYRLERDNNERLVEREGQSFTFKNEKGMISEISKRLC